MSDHNKFKISTHQFVDRIYSKHNNITRKECMDIYDDIIELMSESLVNGNEVFLKGICTIKPKKIEQRIRFDAHRNIPVYTDASTSIKITVSKTLKDKLNGK